MGNFLFDILVIAVIGIGFFLYIKLEDRGLGHLVALPLGLLVGVGFIIWSIALFFFGYNIFGN